MGIQICSLPALIQLAHKPFAPNTALISIGDFGDEPPVLDYEPAHMLRLNFDDIMLSDIDYENCGKYAFRLFSETQAKQIADFVYQHLRDATTFLCQCRFGQSRSAAVAAAIQEHFEHNGMDIFADEKERYSPNIMVFRMTLKALNERAERKQDKFDAEPTAWMIRRDGKAIPCLQHLYGNEENVEETLYAAEWLYQHTAHQKTQALVLDLIAAYGASLNPRRNAVRNLLLAIKNKPYVFLTYSFIWDVMEKLYYTHPDSVEHLNRKVIEQLNSEFLRARLGGLYHTVKGCRDMYFRISSDDFDWSDVILRFLRVHAHQTNTVTIVRDEESTGEAWFYQDANGAPLDKAPYTGAPVRIFPPDPERK